MPSLKIIKSVGLGSQNNKNDVKAVQTALNKLLTLIPPTKSLIEDALLNPNTKTSKTVAAIKLFQSKVLGQLRPDGKVVPNGHTHRKTNEKLISENKTIIKTARNKKKKNRKLRNKISKFKEKLECKICLEQEACVVFEPCGHISCSICSVKLNECHICRSKILKRVHFFS